MAWQWLVDRAQATSFSTEILRAVGMVQLSDKSGQPYDRFRGRLMFPIRDSQSRTVAFGGRVLPEYSEKLPAKYINSPETAIYNKSAVLYGLNFSRKAISDKNDVIITEGYLDTVIPHQNGIDNAVATSGTALTDRQSTILKRYTDTACMVFDSGKNRDCTMMGVTPTQAAEELTRLGADAIGANCGTGVEDYIPICASLAAATPLPIWIKPNAGLPELEDGKVVYRTSPAEFAEKVPKLLEAGARFVGGCCGTSPRFVEAMHRALDG